MKHKYYEVIRAWSEGTPIQYRVILKDDTRSPWVDLSEYSFDKRSPNFDAENVEWRIKTAELSYRVALFIRPNTDINIRNCWIMTYTNQEFNDDVEKSDGFLRWLTDWIEVDLNES